MAATVEERLARLEAQMATLAEQAVRDRPPAIGVTIEDARQRLGKPFVRSPETIAKFRRMYGVFDGPEDLSERMRDYLYGEERVAGR